MVYMLDSTPKNQTHINSFSNHNVAKLAKMNLWRLLSSTIARSTVQQGRLVYKRYSNQTRIGGKKDCPNLNLFAIENTISCKGSLQSQCAFFLNDLGIWTSHFEINAIIDVAFNAHFEQNREISCYVNHVMNGSCYLS